MHKAREALGMSVGRVWVRGQSKLPSHVRHGLLSGMCGQAGLLGVDARRRRVT